MYEIGLDLRIKSGKIILRYGGQEYEIRSNPREPDIYICQDDKILQTVRNGFYTEQIEKMIMRDKEFRSATSSMIGRELLSDILACAIDNGSDSLTFDYVEQLGRQRSDNRSENWERNNQLHHDEFSLRRKETLDMGKNENSKASTPTKSSIFTRLTHSVARERKSPGDMITDGVLAYGVNVGRFLFNEGKIVVYAISNLPHIGVSDVFMTYQITKDSYKALQKMSEKNGIPTPAVPASLTESCHIEFLCGESAYCKRNTFTLEEVNMEQVDVLNKYDNMSSKYFYHGETEREFFLVFSTSHDPDEYYIRVGDEEGIEPEEPLGTIIVSKEYENSWIAQHRYFLDWEVVVVQVEGKHIKGYNDPFCKLLKDNTDAELSGYKHAIFQDAEGRIIATTPLTELVIAESLEEYQHMSEEKIRSMCYCSEMGRAR
ncbi:MAG: hypothetical protein MJZ24_01660 [Paludibacteraceae bacterium]|nr:hypothetical protein [Paludibacteraceae bacterium]